MYRRICRNAIRHISRANVIFSRQLPLLSTVRHYSQDELPSGEILEASPEVPTYDTLWIQVKGYDFAVLESFAKYVHKITDTFGLDISSVFPVPARTSRVQLYKPLSSVVDTEYNLAMYERVLQVENLSSTLAPILIELLQLNTPAGLQMTIKQPDEEEEDFRYVPDLTLIELQAQAAELEKIKEDRKRK